MPTYKAYRRPTEEMALGRLERKAKKQGITIKELITRNKADRPMSQQSEGKVDRHAHSRKKLNRRRRWRPV